MEDYINKIIKILKCSTDKDIKKAINAQKNKNENRIFILEGECGVIFELMLKISHEKCYYFSDLYERENKDYIFIIPNFIRERCDHCGDGWDVLAPIKERILEFKFLEEQFDIKYKELCKLKSEDFL
jgi:hypothetical protein